MVIVGMDWSNIILLSIYIFLVPYINKCLTCLKRLTVQHTPLLLPVLEVNRLHSASLTLEIKILSSGDGGIEHVFAGAAEEHSVELEEVAVLL